MNPLYGYLWKKSPHESFLALSEASFFIVTFKFYTLIVFMKVAILLTC